MGRLTSLGSLIPPGMKAASLRLMHPSQQQFECPVCGYQGIFLSAGQDKPRGDAQCPECGAMERHRLVWLVLQRLVTQKRVDVQKVRVLHFAPERCLRKKFASFFPNYETADISGQNVDHQVDMCQLPFPDGSYGLVVASHVLHHIQNETKALENLHRILQAGGLAVVPVPIFSDRTVEYDQAIDTQWRAPGRDYFERCQSRFGNVQMFSSTDFDEKYQVFVHEDRTSWPDHLALRPRSDGARHAEFVPVCLR